MRPNRVVAVIVVALGVIPAACEYQVTGYDVQPKMTRAPYLEVVLMRRHTVKDVDEIVRGGHCARKDGAIDTGCANLAPPPIELAQLGIQGVCDYWVQPAKDYNDAARLVVAGHEADQHCFGGEHE